MSSIRTKYLAWSHGTPLPDTSDAGPPVFQQWHIFGQETSKWAPAQPSHALDASNINEFTTSGFHASKLRLLTWNIDAFGDRHESRMDGILSEIQQMCAANRGPDIVFFQEVSRKSLACLLQNDWVRQNWISSEANDTHWADVPFATLTLLSRSLFGITYNLYTSDGQAGTTPVISNNAKNNSFSLGSVWRVKYPSRFSRDALCCDVLYNSTARIRLINVHFDSLPIQPSRRPRQVAIAADLVRTSGVSYGVIAGDWNPVLDEDRDLVKKNGLTDAWEHLHPDQDGFTWGLDGKGAPFPPSRLDKIAILGIRPSQIRVIHPGVVTTAIGSDGESISESGKEDVPWSDHSGLLCSFNLGDTKE